MLIKLFLVLFNLNSTELPKLSSWVNDYAKIIPQEFVYELDAVLKNYEEQTGNQIFILTVPSIDPYPTIEDYSLAVAETYKAGAKGVDNGVIITVAVNDRKTRIEVGYGLEDKLPDIIAGRIVRDYMLPYFKEGNYEAGIKEAVTEIITYIGTQKLSNSNLKKRQIGHGFGLIIFLIILFFGRLGFLPFLFLPFLGGSNRSGGSGFGGGFGGGGGGGFGGGGSSGSW